MLKRSITTIELVQLNRMFSSGRGYKDLIRDFKQSFNVELPKPLAKQFMKNRSWSEVLKWLTGDEIQPPTEMDHIPETPRKHFELLEKMLEANEQDKDEEQRLISDLESRKWFVPADTQYFNLPLYGEIITYKYREPYIKCFLFTQPQLGQKRRLDKIEDIPVDDKLPQFLLRIIRVINNAPFEFKGSRNELMKNVELTKDPNYFHYMSTEEIETSQYIDIFTSELFVKYGIVAKK